MTLSYLCVYIRRSSTCAEVYHRPRPSYFTTDSSKCLGRPHVVQTLTGRHCYIADKGSGDNIFSCKNCVCPNSTNGLVYAHPIFEGFAPIVIEGRTTTPTLPSSPAAFGLERQASLPRTTTTAVNPVTQTLEQHEAEVLTPQDVATGNVPPDVPPEAVEAARRGETLEILPHCVDLPHVFDAFNESDRYWSPDDNESFLCDKHLCSHRHNGVEWPDAHLREGYYNVTSRWRDSKLSYWNGTEMSSTQTRTSTAPTFVPPNIIPPIDTSTNPQGFVPQQSNNPPLTNNDALRAICAQLGLPVITTNDLTTLMQQGHRGGGGGPPGQGLGGGGGGPPGGPPGGPSAGGQGDLPAANSVDQILRMFTGALQGISEQKDMRKPDEFTGDPNKARNFIHQCEMYFLAKPQKFVRDDARIRFANSFMKDEGKHKPRSWAITKEKAYIINGWPTWETHKNEFITAYQTADPSSLAIVKLQNLKQGNGTVVDYVTEFNNLCVQAGIPDHMNSPQLILVFVKGLNQALGMAITPHVPQGENLDVW